MATNKSTTPKTDDPRTDTPRAAGTGENTTTTTGEDGRTIVPPALGQEHGYIGAVHPDKDREALTVAGVTGDTANVTDTPKSMTREGTKPVS